MGFVSALFATIVCAKVWLQTPFEEEVDSDSITLSLEKHGSSSIPLFLKDQTEPDASSFANRFSFPVEFGLPPLSLYLPSDLAETGDHTGFDSLSIEPFDNNLPFFVTDYAGSGDVSHIPNPGELWAATMGLPPGLPNFGSTPLAVAATVPGGTIVTTQVPEPGSSLLVAIGVVSLLATRKFRRL